MKELERSNWVAMISHFAVNICMLIFCAAEVKNGTVGIPVLVLMLLFGFGPLIAEVIFWKKSHESKAIKHLVAIGYALFYSIVLFTTESNMVFVFVVPMMFAVMLYHDVKIFVMINVGTVLESILVVILGATTGKFGYLGIEAGIIQIVMMLLLCFVSIYATTANQKSSNENMNDIRDAQERTEATLKSVTEMSNRLETSVAEITVELNKLETAFGSTKMAMEEVSVGSQESAVAVQKQTTQTEAIQEKVNAVDVTAETINKNMEQTLAVLDTGKKDMAGLKKQAEDSALNSEQAAKKLETLDHYMQEMHSIVEIIRSPHRQVSWH